ncbi:putative non-specific serine/threonine protein kinase [Helianthus debilis subsp. tardiflorus]
MGVVVATTLKTTLIFLSFFSALARFETFTRSYLTFNNSLELQAYSELTFQNYARVSQDALQVTPDTSNNNAAFDLRNQSGRVMFSQPFKLFPINGTSGEGLAFLIAPTIAVPDNSYGQYLGLINQTLENEASDVLAIELDTVKQPYDIDNNHIGLNINSIVSVVSTPLTPLNISLASKTPSFHNVWIRYNGNEKVIRVYIAEQPGKTSPTPPMPQTPVIEHPLNLRKAVSSESYIGFAASTGTLEELNCVLKWNIVVKYIISTGSKSPLSMILIAIGVPVVLALVALAGYFCYRLYKKWLVDRSQSNILSRLRTLPGMPKEFRFLELKKATNNFNERRKLGQGGYRVVYHGVLPENNVEVAVKWFSRESLKGEDDFLADLRLLIVYGINILFVYSVTISHNRTLKL